jgi:hypothetical protein
MAERWVAVLVENLVVKKAAVKVAKMVSLKAVLKDHSTDFHWAELKVELKECAMGERMVGEMDQEETLKAEMKDVSKVK